ncbi:4-hydroxythreonine-4-phosphate dehydrogenase PdxA [Aphanizomenon flos-aquae NRERC-008]|jgi:4-hydroxythreonine-4-phosphate dehydrogenase|uniref:4-hydroxythreonine-4-phosphate dehydrogenase n=1 Tax=Aphanizomenon flos-aquae FACHB-1249 TaxID=2692889 RepID=A0ABR8IUX3_APHFL|nr:MULTISPECIES: 4-hydroxythreonine-4-phosphate dehydrogenase PdxA [Aphanizomenon]MBD2390409.1 4-hydroxythreonine-4-phosphate dehydrogenase PdxA [Aphanizomenon flos-aquae FACHB-1171]MBD2557090.1 4-hydroxythreonine-4-phosphate dehydrogenase PdxA [Aphanizomenon flos-aquae FACHB-1290]MBD2632557.1 4-hydroxythreonine-4-phosphate dehydrogenase PdxA [Aphanizomenon sp. FACHB-1399]MBD2643431.1 4-hydroxythreonine-4-phosphate dehydrogenase PdxA [Aphanizomenon sp. FACHB-1401]MBD2657278.1 4-hydroxythreonin
MSNQNNRPRLVVTLGDPAGIGSEVILKALADPEVTQNCHLVVVGNVTLLAKSYENISKNIDNSLNLVDLTDLSIVDITTAGEIITGVGNTASGAASFAYMEYAISRTLAGEFDGIVTGPITKSAWKSAGYNYPGQTELLAERAGIERFGMLFVGCSPFTGWTLRALLATTHIPLCQVSATLTPQLLTNKLDLLVECLENDFGIKNGRIAIAGLNPHSGEMGQLGTEEIDWLIPWLESERQKRPHLQLEGPIPPDTMWVKPGMAWYGNSPVKNPADAYLALYHDQGLIPVKLMAFDRAVNTTIGLPFVRTSPDHGTAFDIAGKGIADATSMKAAIQLAVELVKRRYKV